jgi:cytochrome c553
MGRNERQLLLTALLVGLSGCTAPAQEAGKPSVSAPGDAVTADQVAGTVHVCSSCHGMDGRSISPTFPRLAGQQSDYIETQLKAFRDHTRADPHAHTYMWGIAAHLSDPLIHGLALYFATQSPAPGTPGDAADVAAGQKIFQAGIPDRDVAVCQSCHGEHAEGMSTIPRLAGQHQQYLAKQLENFASNRRANETMHDNSKNLTAADIREISNYLAAQ